MLKYEITDLIKRSDLYFIGNKKILLLHEDYKGINQIGYINNDNIFISEYLLENKKTKISLQSINIFLFRNFINFILDKEK